MIRNFLLKIKIVLHIIQYIYILVKKFVFIYRFYLLRHKLIGNISKLCGEVHKKMRPFGLIVKCWQWAILPARFQTSIFAAVSLNFCVRDENRWTLTLKSPTMVEYA